MRKFSSSERSELKKLYGGPEWVLIVDVIDNVAELARRCLETIDCKDSTGIAQRQTEARFPAMVDNAIKGEIEKLDQLPEQQEE
jgi:hypothetical protein